MNGGAKIDSLGMPAVFGKIVREQGRFGKCGASLGLDARSGGLATAHGGVKSSASADRLYVETGRSRRREQSAAIQAARPFRPSPDDEISGGDMVGDALGQLLRRAFVVSYRFFYVKQSIEITIRFVIRYLALVALRRSSRATSKLGQRTI